MDITLTNNEWRVVGRPVVTIPSSPSPFCLPPVAIHKRLSKPKRVRRKGAGSVASQSVLVFWNARGMLPKEAMLKEFLLSVGAFFSGVSETQSYKHNFLTPPGTGRRAQKLAPARATVSHLGVLAVCLSSVVALLLLLSSALTPCGSALTAPAAHSLLGWATSQRAPMCRATLLRTVNSLLH